MKAVLFLCPLLATLHAQFPDDPMEEAFGGKTSTADQTVVEASLVSEAATIAAGEPFDVALVLDHAPHWHTYYVNPGQAGFPPEISWRLPDGFVASELRFPTPVLGTFADAPFYGYEGRTAFLATITPPADLEPGTSIELVGDASWLACKQSCIPGDAEVSTTVAVGASTTSDPAQASLFDAARAAMPADDTGWNASASALGDSITLRLDPPTASHEPGEVRLFSANSVEDSAAPQTLRKTDAGYELTITRNPELDTPPDRIEGILKASNGWTAGGPQGMGLSLSIGEAPGASDGPATPDETTAMSLPLVLLLMFAGGLILNLMPCVFPVIGLKIMGFVQQAGHSKSKIIAHGLVFTAGVLVSFWILAGILLAGGIRNWGGQLENPLVVFSLLLVMLVMALSMYGVFEIGASATGVGGTLASKEGLGGTFFSGVLATVVATPCSAPLLGGALGVAVTLPGPLFMLAFTLMALGLSLPYLMLSVFPALVDRLPRPGPWMESFKQAMSFLLFGTAGYLLWVYSYQVFDQQAGQKGLWVMLGLTLIAAGFWVYGRWDVPSRGTRVRWIGRIVAIVFVAGGVWAGWPAKAPAPSEQPAASITWEAWSLERQSELIASGTPVYVDFTARWCLTCQTNKAAAYTEAMAEYFEKHGIVALKADKTTSRPDIDEELRRLGKTAIPVNVLYPPGSNEPLITNTVLTESYLRGFLEEHFGT